MIWSTMLCSAVPIAKAYQLKSCVHNDSVSLPNPRNVDEGRDSSMERRITSLDMMCGVRYQVNHVRDLCKWNYEEHYH